MNPDLLSGILLITVAITGTVGLGIYMATVPWWRRPSGAANRAGRAYFSLFSTLMLVVWHFVVEMLFGQQSTWVEVGLIGLLQAAILFNIYTSLSKQIRGRSARRKATR